MEPLHRLNNPHKKHQNGPYNNICGRHRNSNNGKRPHMYNEMGNRSTNRVNPNLGGKTRAKTKQKQNQHCGLPQTPTATQTQKPHDKGYRIRDKKGGNVPGNSPR